MSTSVRGAQTPHAGLAYFAITASVPGSFGQGRDSAEAIRRMWSFVKRDFSGDTAKRIKDLGYRVWRVDPKRTKVDHHGDLIWEKGAYEPELITDHAAG